MTSLLKNLTSTPAGGNGFVPSSPLGFNTTPPEYNTGLKTNESTKRWRRELRRSPFCIVKHADFDNPKVTSTSIAHISSIHDNMILGKFLVHMKQSAMVRALPTESIQQVKAVNLKEFLRQHPRLEMPNGHTITKETDDMYFIRVVAPQMLAKGLSEALNG